MPLFLVTGLPGAGKSTVNAELKARGYKSYDGDEDHLAKWYNIETGLPVEVKIEECTPDFLLSHCRDISREIVKGLDSEAQNKSVFLCGDPENEAELNDLFSEVFALILDDETRNRRLAARTNNKWGKLPHEREYSEAFGKRWENIRHRLSYISIDATQPIKAIVDQILEKAVV
jgi:dephospho-CoA kinase